MTATRGSNATVNDSFATTGSAEAALEREPKLNTVIALWGCSTGSSGGGGSLFHAALDGRRGPRPAWVRRSLAGGVRPWVG